MADGDAIRTGESAEAAGDLLSASAAYESALRSADPLVVADAYFHLGRAAWRRGRFDDAVAAYEHARALAVQQAAGELRARIENGLGAVFYSRGQFAQARAAYGVALQLAGDDTQRGRVLLNLGAIANIEGDLDTARHNYTRSRELFRKTGYVGGEASAIHNLGMLCADLGHWDDADEMFRNCLALCERVHDRPRIARLLLNRSEVNCARGNFEDAISNCDLSIAISTELGDEIERGEALRWKGRAFRLMGRHADAQEQLADAARIGARAQVRLLEAEASHELGLSLAAEGKRPAARKRLERALELFQELGAQRDLAQVRAEIEQLG